MSERIDHVEAAIANGEAAEGDDVSLEEAGVRAQHAIAHGILALVEVQQKANEIAERAVEQQRIANLIALATSAGSPVLDVAARRALVRPNSEDYSDEILPDIREGLGL